MAEELHGALVSSRKEELVAKMQEAAKALYDIAGEGASISIVVDSDVHKGVLTNAPPSEVRAYVDAWEEAARRLLARQN